MKLTRKEFLGSMGALGVGAALPKIISPSAVSESTTHNVDLSSALMPTQTQVTEWTHFLADCCPALTGSPGHTKWVNFLEERLKDAGLKPQRKTFHLPYWELKNYGLSMNGQKIHATGYRPLSGPTPESGVTAPMKYVGASPKVDLSDVKGKILLIDVPFASIDWAARAESIGSYPSSEYDNFPLLEHNAWATGGIVDMKPALDAGALGVINIWAPEVSDGNAQDQEQPWSAPPSAMPTLWVGNATGQKLKEQAQNGASITLTLYAVSHPDTPTDNLWAVLPGQTDDVIIINTHTDGVNACEENGGIGVVSLAKYFGSLPLSQRKKTLVFLMTTGHFGHGYVHGTQDWRDTNPDLMKKAVACVTIEHMGAIEYLDDANGNYKPTGRYVWGIAYTPCLPESGVFFESVAVSDAGPIMVRRPKQKTYNGEGSGFWVAGIPTISYISGSQWLMTAPQGGQLSKIDTKRMYAEIRTLGRCVAQLDKMSATAIRGVQPDNSDRGI